jgi:hypothetical protein
MSRCTHQPGREGRRRHLDVVRLLALVLLPGCAGTPAPGGAVTPDTPAAGALREWLRIHNLGSADSSRAFAVRAYAASELADRPAEVIARGHQLWRMNYGQMRIVRVDSSAPFAIEATVHESLTEVYGKVFVEWILRRRTASPASGSFRSSRLPRTPRAPHR